jgi:RNA recognition motif-containing protein
MDSEKITALFNVPQPSKLANRFLGKDPIVPPQQQRQTEPTPTPAVDPSDPDILRRTVFIGNLPTKCKAVDLKKLFPEKDAIVSVRFRTIQLSADNRLARKVAIRRHAIDEDGSCNTYVVLRTPANVTAAIDKLNGITFMDRVLRVDQATEPGTKNRTDKRTNRLSVFVGHVPSDATEEEIRGIFQVCGPIHHVRLPKNEKGQNRGIAYVTFEDEDAVSLALRFDKAVLRTQTLTVQRSDPIKAQRTKTKQDRMKVKGKRDLGKKGKAKKEKIEGKAPSDSKENAQRGTKTQRTRRSRHISKCAHTSSGSAPRLHPKPERQSHDRSFWSEMATGRPNNHTTDRSGLKE